MTLNDSPRDELEPDAAKPGLGDLAEAFFKSLGDDGRALQGREGGVASRPEVQLRRSEAMAQ